MSMQQLMLGYGAKQKTYLDDVFSTYLYTGNATARSINNGIDLTEGGLVWIKSRNNARANTLFDTVRGANKYLLADHNHGETTNLTDMLTGFNNNGFSLGVDASSDNVNRNTYTQASWSFRKAPGFFDVVTYNGTGSNAPITVDHNLGSIPGFIALKRTDGSENWICWHTSMGYSNNANYLKLNQDTAQGTDGSSPPNASINSVSSTQLVIGKDNNKSGESYVVYIWAGGESTAATATSIDLDGNEGLDIAASSSMNLGTGEFCIEGWFNMDDAPGSGSPGYARLFMLDGPTGNTSPNLQLTIDPSTNKLQVQNGSSAILTTSNKTSFYVKNRWVHFALTRSSNTLTLYLNGAKAGTCSTSANFNPNSGSPRIRLGHYDTSSNGVFNGRISNIRITTNDTVYSSDFKPSTEPLTTTSQGVSSSNVKLLCCNGSTTTSSTVTPGTITAAGSPTASTDSPFDDPDGFAFGDSKEGIVKCGSYVGNGSSTGPEIYLGWEPQWVMVKSTTSARPWVMWDTMRGLVTGGDDPRLKANETEAEGANNAIDLTATGFKFVNTAANWNENNQTFIYIAIRRPDGYVGKSPELGTSVFGLTTGAGSTSRPSFVPNFPVDFNIMRKPGENGNDWQTSARLIGTKAIYTNLSNAEQGHSDYVWDSNVGVFKDAASDYQAWSWKRHAGFDVVTYTGDGVTTGRNIPHSMNAIPQMMWVKKRNSSTYKDWICYHVGIGNTKYLRLSANTAEQTTINTWNNTTPTATHFTIGQSPEANNDGDDFIAMLFASVSGISSVGSYTGNGSATERTITLGFQPRFLMVKNTDSSADWEVLDTTRGWASGSNDQRIWFSGNWAQDTGLNDIGGPTSTGFTITETHANWNANGDNYIYYAHA